MVSTVILIKTQPYREDNRTNDNICSRNDIYGGTYQDPEQTLTSVHPGEPQQTYEVPGDSEISNPTRQYSALHRDENGFSLH
ncbi:hypothetical protein EB796_018715 [Bugula neritina]|uniref:Uncharacterized protein n=1 Tax=Bugula neritina TaxID=10212 RepID=A0A7J7JBF1_BUGNE|nr:hypothetical protein EB796_018715 [Bugula neritina]